MSQPLREQLQQTLSGTHILERELGGGGMARVFVAEELRLRRKVVVKVLSPDLAQGISVERFEREIQTVAALQQANIVPVHSAGDTHGLPFYTMPYVEGESLRARVNRGPLAIADVIDILRDVTRALAYAHQRGVVHRDIKPDNVLMSGGAAVVTDFGIAKAISASRTASGDGLTQIGTSIGSPAYMAPEQVAGDPNVDHRADIYALGATAYELLAGQVVFPGRTPQRVLAAHVTDAPTPIADLRADVPAPLADLVMRCLAKDAEARPQSAADIARELEGMTSASGMRAHAPTLLNGPRVFKRALILYAVSFVAVAIVARVAIVGIGLPDWVYPGALIIMGLGLPVVLWTGYVQRVAQHASATRGTMASLALKAAPHVSWYRTARGGMIALGAFVALVSGFMGLRAAGVGPFATLLGSGRLKEREPILLTDFRTTNTDSTLGRVISDAVRAGLSGSSAITLVPPSTVAAALARMQRPPGTRVDSLVGRELAIREGVKAMVDGEVTGVAGGYIVTIRLVRVDSGVELASFRETGDGPRGLIDAADKVARALRGKAGESLRAVNATPPLAQVTTASLDALRKFSEATRAQTRLDVGGVALAREAVAIDSTFGGAWYLLGVLLRDYGGGARSSIDSAFQRAYQLRDRMSPRERYNATMAYFAAGPGRDRAKAIAATEAELARGDSTLLVALGEAIREQRQFARAESLNVTWVRQFPGRSSSALGNIAELQMDEGNLAGAAATVEQLRQQFPSYAALRQPYVLFAKGDLTALQRLVDSMRQNGPPNERAFAAHAAANLSLLHGRLRERNTLLDGVPLSLPSIGQPGPIDEVIIESSVAGPSPRLAARLDSVIAKAIAPTVPITDRPYLAAAGALARLGNAKAARAMLERYRAEVSDTALRRDAAAAMHAALGELALAEQNPKQAVVEFRRSDTSYDGKPVDECAPCVSFQLGRAFDAANLPDSAIAAFERYLATPYWDRITPMLDPIRVPATHERLGQIYEAEGNSAKAAEHYRAFVDLWKNADVELQPRVADARRRLVNVTSVEKSK